MKLNEVLNLYGLHQNPESLDGHDKAKESLIKRGNWAYLKYEDGDVDVDAGNTDLYAARSMMQAEDAEVTAEPFTPKRFRELLKEVDEYFIPNANTEQTANYKNGRAQFIEAVSKFKPASIASPFIDPGMEGICVFEHLPSLVDMVFTGQ